MCLYSLYCNFILFLCVSRTFSTEVTGASTVESRSKWEPDRNRRWGVRGKRRKREGWREMARGVSQILIFFFITLALCLRFQPPSSCLPNPSTFSAIISRPCLSLSSFHPYFLPASSYQPPTLFLPSVLCSSSFLHLGWRGMLCLSYHLCITFPIRRRREREAERRGARKKKRMGGGREQGREKGQERDKKKRSRRFLA